MRWTDPEGHDWPVTGDYCKACGLPLIRVDEHDTHPTCEGGDGWPTSRHVSE